MFACGELGDKVKYSESDRVIGSLAVETTNPHPPTGPDALACLCS